MFFLIFISIVLTLLIYKFLNGKTPRTVNGLKTLPSAPGGWPIVGHLFKLGSRPFEYFIDVGEKVGPIYKIQIGWKEFLVLNNNEMINKCLKEQGDNFSGRWQNMFSEKLAHFCGVLFKDKEWWETQRAFTLRVLKDFGFGKFQAETVIVKEMERIITILRCSGEKAVSTADLFSLATTNVISDFTMRKDFSESDSEFHNLIGNIRRLAQGAEINNIIVNIFPLFQNFPKIERKLFRFFDKNRIERTLEDLYGFIWTIVNEHKEKFHPNNEYQDLIDAFLSEQNKLNESNTTGHSFIDWQLVRLISELFIAGFETTSSTLTWAMLILSRFPQVQQRMHEEVVDNIGTNRFPTMADKKSLNYCQAVMDEIFRFVTLVPLSLPHRVFNDTSVNGFFIPGNTIIFTNLFACHRDANIWEKPYDFYPEHFLDEAGKYRHRPELIPFGVGKRICLGESLAKMEYFIILVSTVQRFKMSLDAETSKKPDHEIFNGTTGTIRGAIEHKIVFKEIVLED